MDISYLNRNSHLGRFESLLFPVFANLRQHRALEGAGHRRCPNSFGPGLLQHAGTLGNGRPRRHDVVDDDHRRAFDALRVGDAKRSAHVDDALFARETNLRLRRALPLQESASDFEPLWQPLLSSANDQLRLVEAALSALAGMERDRNDQRPEIFAATTELPDRMSQHFPENWSRR